MTPDVAGGADLLATIVAATTRAVEARSERESLMALARRAETAPTSSRSFFDAVRSSAGINVVAECKRRSPSRGVLRADYDPVAIATSYARHGASAISVLTEPTFFDGSLEHLKAVTAAVDVPVLRKDFVVSEYQLFEARAAGADAVLLIVAVLERADLGWLMKRAAALGLDALVEVHGLQELQVALDEGARIVGVNNRNLRTLQVDVHASETLIGSIPLDVVAISESGLKSPGDVLRLRELGYRGFLIGERFMTQPDPGSELKTLLERCRITKDGAAP